MKQSRSHLLRTLSLAFIALFCLALPAYADMGPKPDIIVTVVNAPKGECYVDLLYENSGSSLTSYVDTDGCDPALLAALHSLEGDGWVLACATGVSGLPVYGSLLPNRTGTYSYTYYGLPGTFRLAVATEEGAQATQKSYTRTRFHTNLVYDWSTNALSYVTPSPLYYTAQFLATFLPTLVIEGAILWLFKFRQRRTWLIFFLVNLGTQLGLHLYCDLFRGASISEIYFWGLVYFLALFLPEIVILLVEMCAYSYFLQDQDPDGHCITYAVCANAASYLLGYLPVHWMLPLLNRL